MDLKQFNDPMDVRPYVRNPFSFDGHSYFTNGYIIVRAPIDESLPELSQITDKAEMVSASIVKLFAERDFSVDSFMPLPALDPIAHDICTDCAGTGKSSVCPECGGSGEAMAENDYNDYEVPCRTCNETGRVKAIAGHQVDDCSECNGSGQVNKNGDTPIECCGGHFGLGLGHKIAVLPGIKISYQGDRYVFKFDGGDGVLMPMNV